MFVLVGVNLTSGTGLRHDSSSSTKGGKDLRNTGARSVCNKVLLLSALDLRFVVYPCRQTRVRMGRGGM